MSISIPDKVWDRILDAMVQLGVGTVVLLFGAMVIWYFHDGDMEKERETTTAQIVRQQENVNEQFKELNKEAQKKDLSKTIIDLERDRFWAKREQQQGNPDADERLIEVETNLSIKRAEYDALLQD